MGTGNSGADPSWKNPPLQHLQKYGLVPLPDDFEPTQEERLLLDMYDTIQKCERTAARLKEEAARAKLAKMQEEYEARHQPKNKKKRVRVNKEKAVDHSDADDNDDDEDDDANDDDEASDDESGDEDQRKATMQARREAKLAALREEVEGAKKAQESQEDVLREQLLQSRDDVDVGPLLKRKREETAADPSSLIANLTAASTPPHEFSKNVGLSAVRGHVIFPTSTDQAKWTPPAGASGPSDGAFVMELDDFDETKAHNGQGNNTIAIKFMAPSDSKRFSVNIASSDHKDFETILFHFNPRQHERGGQLVINSKEDGIWGQAVNIPLSQAPPMFGQTSCTLIVQINAEGFDVFIEGVHCARLEHRTDLPPGNNNLVLQFPSTDDYGNPENWAVFRVWWGNHPILAKGDVSGVAGVNAYVAFHPRKLFISGLQKIYSEPEVDLRRAEIERAFRKYGGERGVQVIVPTNATYAFVEMESERQTDLALAEMSNKYRINRSKRSRREALWEERAAKEAAAANAAEGVATRPKEGGEWD